MFLDIKICQEASKSIQEPLCNVQKTIHQSHQRKHKICSIYKESTQIKTATKISSVKLPSFGASGVIYTPNHCLARAYASFTRVSIVCQ